MSTERRVYTDTYKIAKGRETIDLEKVWPYVCFALPSDGIQFQQFYVFAENESQAKEKANDLLEDSPDYNRLIVISLDVQTVKIIAELWRKQTQ